MLVGRPTKCQGKGAQEASLLAEGTQGDARYRLKIEVRLDCGQEDRAKSVPRGAHAATEDDGIGVVERHGVHRAQAEPSSDVGPCRRVVERAGVHAEAALDGEPAGEGLETAVAPAVAGGSAGPFRPEHLVAALGVVPACDQLAVADHSGADAGGDGEIDDRAQSAGRTRPGLRDGRAIRVVLHGDGAPVPLSELRAELEPVPGDGHAGWLEEGTTGPVEWPRRGDADRLGGLAAGRLV